MSASQGLGSAPLRSSGAWQSEGRGAGAPLPANASHFWDDLLRYVEKGRVIPVVGAELLVIERDGVSVPLYKAVAERLLADYGVSAPLREHFELNDAVCALDANGYKPRELYGAIHDILRGLTDRAQLPPALCQLAAISHFNLFVSTTPDDFMARALNQVRFRGSSKTDEIIYAPKLATDNGFDIPAKLDEGYAGVFYLFGKADVDPLYAIHDEDQLEFTYKLQDDQQPARIFAELQSRSLLLIGCTFGDWLGRFFLRLSNCERLSSNQRQKREFLLGEETARDHDFTVFLERFSQDTRCYKTNASVFVAELYRRWSERHPAAQDSAPSVENSTTSLGSGHSIFLSYAREDIGAARQLYTDLQKLSGNDVAWLDKTNITPGDEWRKRTDAAIRSCELFLAVISQTTERRGQGEFFGEWKRALEYAQNMSPGRKFIFPVVIDENYDGDARAYLNADFFHAYHFAHAPGGRMSDDLRMEIQNQLRRLRRTRAS